MEKQDVKNINEFIKELEMVKLSKESTPNNFLTIEKYRCLLNNGKTIIREKLLKGEKDGSAVVILPITCDKKVILVAEPRVFTKRTVDIGLPAGYIEKKETPEEAAKRELQEETGYTTNHLIPLGAFYQDQGISAAYNHYFVALHCKKVSNQHLDKDEVIKYFMVDLNDLERLVNNEYIMGLNSAYTIEKGMKLIRKLERENKL